MSTFSAVSPVDGTVFATRPYASFDDVSRRLDRAAAAWPAWQQATLSERLRLVRRFIDAVEARKEQLASELTLQMGRPSRFAAGEIDGFCFRGRTLCDLATEALGDVNPPRKEGFSRFIRREALGTVLILAPWNYPYLTAVNAIVPALLAGNAVLLKHSEQTPLVADRLREAAETAGLPPGIFQTVDMSNDTTAQVVADSRVAFVQFTGSVEGGRAVHSAAAGTFKAVALELGGKDPAYVRADANLDFAVPNLVEGAFFNSGQSCCAVERIYVDRSIYDTFVERFVEESRGWSVADPTDRETFMGPMVRTRNAESVRAQVARAVQAGARALLSTEEDRPGTPYMAPQVLVDVTDDMEVMCEESFGPIIGILPVDGDDDAIERMNNSRYGLTASVWTADSAAARELAGRLDFGTVFANRCDYLDPELAWVGVRDSGRGVSLSRLGFDAFTRPKSFHLREQP